ncbi:MAG: ATP-binding protein, partial [Chloroflexota bacterium]
LRPFTAQIEEKEQILDNKVIHKELPDIYGDPNRLIQVMTNFVSNANKYSQNGATITLDASVERDKRDPNGKLLGDFLHITVADNGIGISEEDQKKMFKPYFRSTNDEAQAKPGTGLGMYLTRRLIEQHGGNVWLESDLGKGTTFHFTIPLAPEEEPASEPASD